jgi:hypothetical protein
MNASKLDCHRPKAQRLGGLTVFEQNEIETGRADIPSRSLSRRED